MKTATRSPIKSSNIAVHIAELLDKSTADQSFNNWFNIPDIRQAHEILATRFIDSIPSLPKPKGSGRGIVIPGGGTKYFPSMWVGINRLRQLGCKLPIEVWYLGEVELDYSMKRLLSPFDVTFRDAMELRKKHPMRILNGWELKPYAIANSAFDDVLFIDADCAPTRDPEFIFETEQYKETGAIFWPDYPHWMLRYEAYDVFGAPRPKNIKIPGDDYQMFGLPIDPSKGWDVPVESGQMVINKTRCWAPLNLTLFFCAYSDFYFRFVHGDKETFHLGWRRLGYKYGMPQRWPHWDLHTALQYDFDGQILFTHRNNDKWKISGNTTGSGRIPFERECFALVDELAKHWNGRIWDNVKPTAGEKKDTEALLGKTFFYHRVGHDARLIEFGKNNLITKGKADNEVTWSIFHISGKTCLVISGKDSPTCFLRRERNGRWKGEWMTGERMPVEIIPVNSE